LKNGQAVRVALKDVNDFITCSVCLGIIKHTSMVAECTHRFCKACIEASLRKLVLAPTRIIAAFLSSFSYVLFNHRTAH